jgi:hypothetical protein
MYSSPPDIISSMSLNIRPGHFFVNTSLIMSTPAFRLPSDQYSFSFQLSKVVLSCLNVTCSATRPTLKLFTTNPRHPCCPFQELYDVLCVTRGHKQFRFGHRKCNYLLHVAPLYHIVPQRNVLFRLTFLRVSGFFATSESEATMITCLLFLSREPTFAFSLSSTKCVYSIDMKCRRQKRTRRDMFRSIVVFKRSLSRSPFLKHTKIKEKNK